MNNQERENQKNKFYSSKNFGKSFNPNFKMNKSPKSEVKENQEPENQKKPFEKEQENTKTQNFQKAEKNGSENQQESKAENNTSSAQEKKQFQDKPQERTVSCEEYLKLKYQLADMINKYKQLDAEFENYRKRTREEIKDSVTKGRIEAIELVLPALDSFKKARLIIKDEKNLEGIALIEKSLMQALNKQNVKKIDCIGKEFNPDYHNAVAIVSDPTKEPNTIIDEVEAGYTLNDKVIKFSQVVVSK